MKMPIAGILTASLVLAAGATFAQTSSPAMPTNPGASDKAQERAEHHKQWEECMAREGAKHGGTGQEQGHRAGAHKDTEKAAANNKGSEATGSKGATKKENRHQEEMQACREQLYGKSGKESAPATK